MIRVQVLGRLTLEARGEAVHALSAQPLRGSVFLYLCVEREATRDALVRLFWPDRDEDRARRLLSQTLYELKRLLGEDWFNTAGELVRLENVSVDVHAFEVALKNEPERALALYRGRFLSDFQRFDSPEFNAWVDRRAAHYDRLHRRARRDRIKQLLEEGDRPAALAVAQHWSELDPLEDEAVHRTLELQHELGMRAEALQTYEAYVLRLKDVELVPLEDTRALAARIRASSVAPLVVAPPPMMTPPAAPAGSEAPTPRAPSETFSVAGPWYRQKWARAGVLAAALAVVALLAFIVPNNRGEMRSVALPLDSAGFDLSRVAVLYFDDHTEGGTLDYLAKGLTEALIAELTRVEALSVTSRNWVKPYHNSNVSTDSIARALQVGTIVEGSVQQAGSLVRVQVHLVDARTGQRLHSRTLDRPVTTGFQLEDDVVREVGLFLRHRLGREIQLQRIARGVRNLDAYRLYQTADAYRQQIFSATPRQRAADPRKYEFLFRSADSLLIEAEQLDPQWIEPTLLRGWLAADQGVLTLASGSSESNKQLQSAIHFADRISRRSPRNGRALELRGSAFARLAANALGPAGDSLNKLAQADLRAAVRADHTRSAAWARLSQLLQFEGKNDEAELYAQRALAADAFMNDRLEIVNRLYRIAMDQDRFDKAEEWCLTGYREFPDHFEFVECQLLLPARNPLGLIRPDSAYRLLEKLARLDPPAVSWDYQPVFRQTLLARIWAKNQQRDSALAILNRARRMVARDSLLRAFFRFDAAHVLLLAGDTTDAANELRAFLELNPQYRKYLMESKDFRAIAPLLQ